MPDIVGRMPPAGKAKLLEQLRDDDGVGISKGDAQRFNFCNIFNVVTFLRDVLREDRSSPAPGAEAAMDQSAAAVESGFLFDQSADLRFAVAHGLRKRAMPESLGMLEPGYRYFHDRRRPLHTGMRILRGDDSKTVRA
jgi:hypothetical protein